MASTAQEDLWRSIEMSDAPRFAEISRSLELTPTSRNAKRATVPLRLYLRTGPAGIAGSACEQVAVLQGFASRQVCLRHVLAQLCKATPLSVPLLAGYMPSYENVFYSSRPVDAVAEDGTPLTLLDMLQDVLPAIFPADTVAALQQGPAESAEGAERAAASHHDAAGQEPDASSRDEPLASGFPLKRPAVHDPAVTIAGIQPELQSPLAWLHANLQAPDCFLYVVVHCSDGGAVKHP